MSRIQGLSIELGMASGEIQRSTAEIKRSMRGLSSEAKVVTNNFKYGKRDTDNYRDAVDKLTKTTDKQRENVEELGKRYAKTVEEQGASSKAAQDLAIEYNKQADNLNRLEHELSDMETELAKVTEEQRIAESQWTKTGKAMEEQGEKMKKVGGGMEKVGGIFTAMSAAVIGGAVGITGSLFALTNKATETADAIAKGSERMGISTDFYQEMDFWASQNGLSQDNLEKAVGRLNQRMGLALEGNEKYASALGRLGVDLDAVREGTLSTEDAMTQSIQALSEMENEHEKAALATEMFGTKLSRELLPALNDGSLSIEDAKQKAEELGLVLSEDQLYAAEAFQDAQDQIKRALGAVTTQIGLDLMPMFQNMMDWVLENMPQIREMIMNTFDRITGAVMSVVEWWKELSDTQRRLIPIIAGVALAFGPIILIAGKVATAIGGIMTVMGPMVASVGAAGGLFSLLRKTMGSVLSPFRRMISPVARLSTTFLRLSNPIGWVITGLAALTAGFVLAYRNSEPFRDGIDGIVDSVKDAWEWVTTFKDGIVGLFTGNEGESHNIFENLGLSEETIETIQGWSTSLIENFESLKTTVTETFEGLKESVDRIWTALGTIFTNVWNDYIKPALDWLTEGFENLMEYLGIEMPSLDQLISGAFSSAKFSIDVFSGVIEGLLETAERVFGGVADALESVSEGDWEQAWQDIKDMFGDIGEIWTDVWDNIKETIDEHFGDTIEAVKQWAIDLWDKINEWYGKKSLEVTATLIGWYLSVLGWWDDLKTNISTKTEELWDDVKEWFKTKTREIIGTIAGWYLSLAGWWDSIKEAVSEKSEEIWSSAKEWFDQLPDSMSDALSRVGQTISGWGESLKNRGYNLGVNIANGVINGLNWMIDRVNDVARFLGLDRDLITGITPIGYKLTGSAAGGITKLSTGTNFHTGGLALVGDKGIGNSPGGSGIGDRSVTRELIKLPDKTEYLADGNVLLDLPTGSQVLSNRETEDELKKRVFGTDVGGGMLDNMLNWMNIITKPYADSLGNQYVEQPKRIASVGQKLGNFAADLWSYASNPMSLFNEIFNDVVNKHLNVPEGMFPLAVGAINKLGDVVSDWISGLFTKSGKADGSYILNKSISHFFGRYNAGAGSMLFGVPHYGIDTRHHYDPLHSPVNGKVTNTWFDAMGGNSIQVSQGNGRTWWFMHLDNIGVSKGANVNVGDYLGKTGNTGSFTTGPHLHTQLMQGGIGNAYAIDPLPTLRSHKNGGYIETDGLFNLHANEMVLPLDNPTYAMKLIALASKKMAGKSKQTNELPNVGFNNDTVVEKLVEQNSILMKMLEKLTGIESKDLVIGDEDIGRANDRYSARQSSKQSVTTGRMRYV